jgi:hypothetical protein
MKNGTLLIGAVTLGALTGVFLAERKGGLGAPPVLSPRVDARPRSREADPYRPVGRDPRRGGGSHFRFFGTLPQYAAPPVIVLGREVMENPCEAPWLFRHPEAACLAYRRAALTLARFPII